MISFIIDVKDEKNRNINHVKVYYEEGMFGGWPANHGIWIWDNEIVVGFSQGFHQDRGNDRHNIAQDKPELHLLARSLDGGTTWNIEDPGKKDGALVVPENGAYHGIIREDVLPPEPIVCTEKINFKHHSFALTARSDNNHNGEARYWTSYDRGRNWTGPCKLSSFDTAGIAARTDYIVNSHHETMLFLTAAKSNGREGRPMVIQTTDGGKEWSFLSWIGPEPDGFSIMPSSARLSENEILVTVRRREGPEKRFISAFLSTDSGRTWSHLNDPVDVGIGNPPAMIKLSDGRVALAYAYRSDSGSHMGLKFSSDKGQTWSDEIILRANDGAGRDVGYPRMVQRPDGKLVIVYYWNHALDEQRQPYRYIAATIVDPAKI